ncbi:MAG: bifunctional phosphoribosyl-AMP cyclohydrolase/phosphoribosyl-ATP diphosphatase HisIE [Anaerolineae bacterium]|nr:bifunctional phosphoribosyl-AMP cyclohydrolase/phosphoribosyl-ATP diphosphatase HisIE [Anaerolineae bacterium]
MEAEIRWDEQGLVPAIVQDAHTGQVLMLAYMNGEALARTLETGQAWFWSRSRGELWHKGATSGNMQRVVEVRYDCDADALLLRVEPRGPACHTGHTSCFYRRLPGSPEGEAEDDKGQVSNLPLLWAIIQERKAHPKEGSYTCHLLAAGQPEILKKVGEEAVEAIVAAQCEGDARLVSELADLTYHILVLLAARGLSWADVEAELARRFPIAECGM